jgi:hypothetical protein
VRRGAAVFGTDLTMTIFPRNSHQSNDDDLTQRELRWRSPLSDSLPSAKPGDRIPVGARFSAPVQTFTEAHNGYRDIPGSKAGGAWRYPPTPI